MIKLKTNFFTKLVKFSSLISIVSISFWCALLLLFTTLYWNFNQTSSLNPPQAGLLVLFHPQTNKQAVDELIFELNQNTQVLQVAYQSKQQALNDLEAALNLGDILSYLPENPLPSNLLITPSSTITKAQLTELTFEITAWPTVAQVTQTGQWLSEYSLFSSQLQVLFKFFFLVCCLGLVLHALNRIGLIVDSQKDEIFLQALMGATGLSVFRSYLTQLAPTAIIGYLIATLLSYLAFWGICPIVNNVTTLVDITLPGHFLQLSQWIGIFVLAFGMLALGTAMTFIKYRTYFRGDITW
ncbi:MAG: hypothetical protein CMF48_03215 [Legionellales bacterium]|nr:hypothetical protein [Legionellales bacterium]|tara:strand:- start:1459 stop:2352 length:894 start_codon:yes stop_codon:yes gene_type:complete